MSTVSYIIEHGKARLRDDPGYGSDYILLTSNDDFKWYKKSLDLQYRQELPHDGEPTNFPCFVYSEYENEGDRSNWWRHKFVYRESTTCESCGHVLWYWPKVQDD
jgi:hypothetical protein